MSSRIPSPNQSNLLMHSTTAEQARLSWSAMKSQLAPVLASLDAILRVPEAPNDRARGRRPDLPTNYIN